MMIPFPNLTPTPMANLLPMYTHLSKALTRTLCTNQHPFTFKGHALQSSRPRANPVLALGVPLHGIGCEDKDVLVYGSKLLSV